MLLLLWWLGGLAFAAPRPAPDALPFQVRSVSRYHYVVVPDSEYAIDLRVGRKSFAQPEEALTFERELLLPDDTVQAEFSEEAFRVALLQLTGSKLADVHIVLGASSLVRQELSAETLTLDTETLTLILRGHFDQLPEGELREEFARLLLGTMILADYVDRCVDLASMRRASRRVHGEADMDLVDACGPVASGQDWRPYGPRFASQPLYAVATASKQGVTPSLSLTVVGIVNGPDPTGVWDNLDGSVGLRLSGPILPELALSQPGRRHLVVVPKWEVGIERAAFRATDSLGLLQEDGSVLEAEGGYGLSYGQAYVGVAAELFVCPIVALDLGGGLIPWRSKGKLVARGEDEVAQPSEEPGADVAGLPARSLAEMPYGTVRLLFPLGVKNYRRYRHAPEGFLLGFAWRAHPLELGPTSVSAVRQADGSPLPSTDSPVLHHMVTWELGFGFAPGRMEP